MVDIDRNAFRLAQGASTGVIQGLELARIRTDRRRQQDKDSLQQQELAEFQSQLGAIRTINDDGTARLQAEIDAERENLFVDVISGPNISNETRGILSGDFRQILASRNRGGSGGTSAGRAGGGIDRISGTSTPRPSDGSQSVDLGLSDSTSQVAPITETQSSLRRRSTLQRATQDTPQGSLDIKPVIDQAGNRLQSLPANQVNTLTGVTGLTDASRTLPPARQPVQSQFTTEGPLSEYEMSVIANERNRLSQATGRNIPSVPVSQDRGQLSQAELIFLNQQRGFEQGGPPAAPISDVNEPLTSSNLRSAIDRSLSSGNVASDPTRQVIEDNIQPIIQALGVSEQARPYAVSLAQNATQSPLNSQIDGFPELALALVQSESNFNNDAVSRTRARGLGQFTTAATNELNRVYGNRFLAGGAGVLQLQQNPELATEAIVKTLDIVADQLLAQNLPVTIQNLIAGYKDGVGALSSANGDYKTLTNSGSASGVDKVVSTYNQLLGS